MNVHEALAKRYPVPEYALLFEVANATGGRRTRAADALVMSLWPSRGLDLMGFEIKSSRSDWLREKRDPAKAEGIWKYCDRWYLVTTDGTIAKPDEIPPTWGHLVLGARGFVCAKDAPKLEPEPVSRHFLAGLLRRLSTDYVPERVVRQRIADDVEAAARNMKERNDAAFERMERDLRALQENVRDFEKASGIRICDRWHSVAADKIGNAVRYVLAGGLENERQRVERLRADLAAVNERLQQALEIGEALAEVAGQATALPFRSVGGGS